MFAIFCCTKWCFQSIIWKLKSMKDILIATNLFDLSVVCYCELLDGSDIPWKSKDLYDYVLRATFEAHQRILYHSLHYVCFSWYILFVTISHLICGVISSDIWLELLPKSVHLLLMNVLMFTAIKLHLSWSILSWFNG